MIYIAVKQHRQEEESYEHTKSVVFSDPPPRERKTQWYELDSNVPGINADALIKEINSLLEKFARFDCIVESLRYYNEKLDTFAHYLRNSDLQEVRLKINELENEKQQIFSLTDEINSSSFSKIAWDSMAYLNMVKAIENTLVKNPYQDLHKINCSCIKNENDTTIYLLPQAIIKIDHSTKRIKASSYDDIEVELSERKRYADHPADDDDIAEITYLHTKKDGTPDLRYSYENNPTVYYVYTGRLHISSPAADIYLNYRNRQTAQLAYNALIEYKKKLLVQNAPVPKKEEPPKQHIYIEQNQLNHASLLGLSVNHCVYGKGIVQEFKYPNYYIVEFNVGRKEFTTSTLLNKRYFTF